MTWAAVAIGGSSLIGAIGSGIAGKSASDAQNRSDQANLLGVRETNEQNYRMFREGRGSAGHAILPEYLGGAEQELGTRAVDASRLLFGNPGQDFARDKGIVDSYLPSQRGVRDAINELFSGANLQKRLGIAEPVAEARTNVAKGQTTAINQSVRDAISRLESGKTRSGFVGGGSFDTNRILGATIGGRQAAAGALGDAELENATIEAFLRDNDIQARLAGIDLPNQGAAAEVSLRDLPNRAAANRLSNAMAPLNFFRLAADNFRAERPPLIEPGIGAGEIWGGGLSQLGNAAGTYFQNKAFANALNKAGGGIPEVSMIY